MMSELKDFYTVNDFQLHGEDLVSYARVYNLANAIR